MELQQDQYMNNLRNSKPWCLARSLRHSFLSGRIGPEEPSFDIVRTKRFVLMRCFELCCVSLETNVMPTPLFQGSTNVSTEFLSGNTCTCNVTAAIKTCSDHLCRQRASPNDIGSVLSRKTNSMRIQYHMLRLKWVRYQSRMRSAKRKTENGS